jgi:hypothetical protein
MSINSFLPIGYYYNNGILHLNIEIRIHMKKPQKLINMKIQLKTDNDEILISQSQPEFQPTEENFK